MDANVIRAVRFDIKSEAYTEICWENAAQIFRDMVNQMLEYGLKNKVHNATSLEKKFYHTFKTHYGMATSSVHIVGTAVTDTLLQRLTWPSSRFQCG
ncbi:MAG: hypothetical protein QW279_10920 [Candidatus Jordarchaeaceae archaeon]